MNEHVRTIEVEGQKFEVDMRTAKKIEAFRVGDRVKVLMKDYSGYKTSPGVIVGIDVFKKLPTIVIAYMPSVLKWDSNANIEFAYLNSSSTDLEICPMCEDDVLPNRETIVMAFDRAIADGECKMSALRAKKEFFLRQYGSAFSVDAVDMEASLAGETNAS